MRITFVLPDANMMGGTRVIAIYAERLQRRGHQVCVVSTPRRGPEFKQQVKTWLKGQGWPMVPPLGPSHLDGAPVEHRVIDRWRPVIDSDVPDADAVIATWWETAPWVAGLSPNKGAKTYFVQDYGAHAGQPLDKVAATWRHPMHKITISRFLCALIHEQCGDRDVTYVPNSVDLDQFFAPPRGKQRVPTVGTVYSRRPQKGCDVALAAYRLAAERVKGLRLVAFGEKPDDLLPLPAGVAYFPNAAESQLRDIYAQCDAWLFASRKEGFGLPILEAMACRTPVIATAAGAAPELIADNGGWLVGIDDIEGMAGAIEEAATLSDEAWCELSAQVQAKVSSYSWDDATALFEAGLIRAIEKGASRPMAAAVPASSVPATP